MNKKVSICMIVKNEEANLKRCLDSFLPIIHERWSELVIVDTGSKDRTLEVARQYTRKIFEKRFVPWDFSKARNFGISKAIGEKIMIVDADEELRQDCLYPLEDILLNPKITAPTVFIKLLNFYTKDRKQYSETLQGRIFNNDGKFHYESNVHNKPIASEPYLFAPYIVFNHYGYMFQDKMELFKKKRDRSLPLLEKAYKKDPNDLHISTHLIKTYWLMSEHDKVIALGEKWMIQMRKISYHEGWSAFLEGFINIVGSYIMKENIKDAERVAKESRKYSRRITQIDIMLGNFYSDKDPKRARKYFERVILQDRDEGNEYEKLLTSNTNIIIPEILNYLAILDFQDGDYTRAGKRLNKGIIANDNRLELRWDIFNERDAKQRLIGNGTEC